MIEFKKECIDACRRHHAKVKAKQQNELLKLRTGRNITKAALTQQLAVLTTLKGKNKHCAGAPSAVLDMSAYRLAVTTVFADSYLPAFCISKQASLLRAVHFMMCCDQASIEFQQQCAEDLRDHDLTVIQQQDCLAVSSQQLLNTMMMLDNEIHCKLQEISARHDRVCRLERAVTHNVSFDEEEGEFFHDVSLMDESLTKDTSNYKQSDQSVDTVSLSYCDGDSCDESNDFFAFSSSSHSIPRFVHRE